MSKMTISCAILTLSGLFSLLLPAKTSSEGRIGGTEGGFAAGRDSAPCYQETGFAAVPRPTTRPDRALAGPARDAEARW